MLPLERPISEYFVGKQSLFFVKIMQSTFKYVGKMKSFFFVKPGGTYRNH
jgi:hypothetical protein